jgi:hypothetical protein
MGAHDEVVLRIFSTRYVYLERAPKEIFVGRQFGVKDAI